MEFIQDAFRVNGGVVPNVIALGSVRSAKASTVLDGRQSAGPDASRRLEGGPGHAPLRANGSL